MELAKEKAAEERLLLRKGKAEEGKGGGAVGKGKAKGKGKGKGKVKKAAVAAAQGAAVVKKRGRPPLEPGVCGRCRWIAERGGCSSGGHGHAEFCPLWTPPVQRKE